MTIEQIIKLSDIGFTADEIKQLSNGGTEPAESAGETNHTTGKKPGRETSDTTTGTKPAEPATETVAFSNAVNALMKEISGLKKTIQATNILNSNAGKEEPQSVDTILKSFMKGNEKVNGSK